MKSTGVIRKIDELGRIVIPKEIRRNLRIRDGENLEIFVDDSSIILKKYSKMLDCRDLALKLCEAVSETFGCAILITDREEVIATSSSKVSAANGKEIDKTLISFILNSESFLSDDEVELMFQDVSLKGYIAAVPVITSMDTLGIVVMIEEKPITSEQISVVKLISKMLADKIDIA